MKKMSLFLAVAVLLVFCASVFAQNVSKGDTLIVSPADENGAPLLGALNMAIHGDTTGTGERVHKVYKLLRNAQYILTEVIQADFPLKIVADDPDDTHRPPIIRCGLNADGGNVNNWWHIYDDAYFKNIWASGINLDGTGPIAWITQTVNASGKTIHYDGCILEAPYTWWAMFTDNGGRNVYKINNCIFKNVGNPTGAIWNGAVFNSGNSDSVIIKNSTFYKFGCFAAKGGFYTEIDHCTFVNSVVHPIDSHEHVIRKYTNNLFVNCHAYSDDFDEISRHFDVEVKGLMNYAEIQWDPQKLDSLYGPGGEYNKNYDPNGDGELTEGETVWELKNNNWFYTQPIKDYWAQFDNVVPNPWMNNYNKAMFESSDETSVWTWDLKVYIWADSAGNIIENPEKKDTLMIVDSTIVAQTHEPFRFFMEENTMNVDPGIVDMQTTDELLAQNCINIRKESAGEEVTPVKWHNVDNYLAFTWPLEFDLSYTNTSLQTAGTDGMPIGDVYHWFPEQYSTAVEKRAVTPDDFALEANFPNPFNPTTTINYKLNTTGNVKLTVYNMLGKEVKTLVNQDKTAGSYSVQWDGTNNGGAKVSSGVYFYRLEMGNQAKMHKMLLVK
jgi:hypothetical protein